MSISLKRLSSAAVAVAAALSASTVIPTQAALPSPTTSPVEAQRLDAFTAPEIVWEPCGDRLECASVAVPLDYDKPNAQQIRLGITRLPARNQAERIGSLFLNPGGPGGTATDFVERAAELLSPEILDRFDLVGMDPRGLGKSTNTSCFPNQMLQDRRTGALSMGFPITAAQEQEFIAANQAIAKACSTKGKKMASATSTAQVARDMEVLRQALGDEQLNFLGFSYGTVLGQTYANMFPDRFRTIAVDGVLNPEEWVGTKDRHLPMTARIGSAEATERVFRELMARCEENPAVCPLQDPQAQIDAVFARLKEGPLTVEVPGEGSFGLTYQEVIVTMVYALYDPAGGEQAMYFVAMLHQLVVAEEAGSAVPSLERKTGGAFARLQEAATENGKGKATYQNDLEFPLTVMCNDGHNPRSVSAWPTAVDALSDVAPTFAPHWVWGSAACAGDQWTALDEDAYRGPFNKVTANPVLVVGNYWDPSTSYEGAVESHALLPNSALVLGDNWGHTAYGNSECATAAVDRYLLSGEVPEGGVLECEGAPQPFEG